MNRLYTMTPNIRALDGSRWAAVGPACTVKLYPGDNLMVHKALDLAQPGDVIVVNASFAPFAALGDLVSNKARHRGRRLRRRRPRSATCRGSRRRRLPVLRSGRDADRPLHRGPGEINYPIAAGGVVVHPGDVIVADMNGVVVVPRDSAEEILDRLRDRKAKESDYTAAVARGDFSNDWVDATLQSAGSRSTARSASPADLTRRRPRPPRDRAFAQRLGAARGPAGWGGHGRRGGSQPGSCGRARSRARGPEPVRSRASAPSS